MFEDQIKALRDSLTKEIAKLQAMLTALNGFGGTPVQLELPMEKPAVSRQPVKKSLAKPANLVTAGEAADMINVHRGTVITWVHTGKIWGRQEVRQVIGTNLRRRMMVVDPDEVMEYAAQVENDNRNIHRKRAGNGEQHAYPLVMDRMVEEVLKDVPPGVSLTAAEVRKSAKQKFGQTLLIQSILASLSKLHRNGKLLRPYKGHYMIKDRSTPAAPAPQGGVPTVSGPTL